METIEFGLALKYDTGRSPAVATNGTVAVEVHNSEASSDMWYHIGTIREATIEWGPSVKYSSGYHPAVAIRNDGTIIQVHETSNVLTNSLYYKIGKINGSRIDWWGGDQKYDSGRQPSVAVNDKGVVVEVHKSQSFDKLYYRVGQIEGNKISWGDSHQYDSGVTPSVAINNSGQIVEVHKSEWRDKLFYRTGLISSGRKIQWSSSREYQDGVSPSVGLTADGRVVEVHSSEGITGLWQLSGVLNGEVINWSGSSNFDSGASAHVGISSDGHNAVQVHQGDFYGLWYSNSRLMDTANFMSNLLPVTGSLPLRKMVLPAAHDAGMYTHGISTLGKTQDLNIYEQLKAGVRYFDFRVDGNLRISHGPIGGPPLEDVVNDIRRFYGEGHHELAILKFSHFDSFSQDAYTRMKRMISDALGQWLFTSLPSGVSRLADVTMSTYIGNKGSILVVVDDNWAIDYPQAGFWVYRDWNSSNPKQGSLTVFDQYSNTTSYEDMKKDQLQKLANFNGRCEKDPSVPCDLFLLSWTLTPVTGVWLYAKEANRQLGAVMSFQQPNNAGFFANLLYLDYVQYARPTFIADILTKRYNRR